MRLIDANALKEALKSNCKPEICHDYGTNWCKACCHHNDFEDLIDNAPTVQRPQGEWKLHGMIYYCSNCGHYCGESGDNFCGNCGADMRGVNYG